MRRFAGVYLFDAGAIVTGRRLTRTTDTYVDAFLKGFLAFMLHKFFPVLACGCEPLADCLDMVGCQTYNHSLASCTVRTMLPHPSNDSMYLLCLGAQAQFCECSCEGLATVDSSSLREMTKSACNNVFRRHVRQPLQDDGDGRDEVDTLSLPLHNQTLGTLRTNISGRVSDSGVGEEERGVSMCGLTTAECGLSRNVSLTDMSITTASIEPHPNVSGTASRHKTPKMYIIEDPSLLSGSTVALLVLIGVIICVGIIMLMYKK